MDFQLIATRSFYATGVNPDVDIPITVNNPEDANATQKIHEKRNRQAIRANIMFTLFGAVFAAIVAQFNPVNQVASSLIALIVFDLFRMLFALGPMMAIPAEHLANEQKITLIYQRRLLVILAVASTPLRFVEYVISLMPILVFFALASNGHGEVGEAIKNYLDEFFSSLFGNDDIATFAKYGFSAGVFLLGQVAIAAINRLFQRRPHVVALVKS